MFNVSVDCIYFKIYLSGLCTGAGYIVNINEVGGVYSGVLFGISNSFGTLPGWSIFFLN